MDRLSLTQEELANILGRAQPTISEILRGNRSISPEIALDFEAALNGQVDAAKLMEMQAAYQLEEARSVGKSEDIRLKAKLRSEFPITEMEKRGWIPKFDEVEKKLNAVLAFANGSEDLDQIRPPFECRTFARQSATLGYLSPAGCASRAWQYRVRELAEMTPVKKFRHEIFADQGMKELRGLVRVAKNVAQVPQVLAKYGVRFVVVQHLSGTKLEGAAAWLDSDQQDSPVVALTLRFGTVDSFWFNLAHELHHIKFKHSLSVDSDGLKTSEQSEVGLKDIEDEANRAAADWLIPSDRLAAFIRRNGKRVSEANVLAFAQMVDVHPGVLVGMLNHEGAIPYGRFAEMKVDVRKFVLMAAMADGHDVPAPKRANQNIER